MMSDLFILSSNNTPSVAFSLNSKIQKVSGISTPIDSFEFYRPLIQWISDYQEQIPSGTVFRFELNYFNSSSMKALLWLIQAIANGVGQGKSWSIEWVVTEDDEFMEEAGESFQSLIDIPLNIVRV
jgi:SiaC family regulatory phosphoprotein